MTSMAEIVMALIDESPGSNVDDLLPRLPGYTRHQVKQALQNLAFRGKVRCERQGVKGQHKGAKPGRYWVIERAAKASPAPFMWRVSSVWELGART